MINMLASLAEEERTNELKLTHIHVFTCSQVLKVISEGETDYSLRTHVRNSLLIENKP